MVSDYMVSGAGLALSFPPLVMFDLPAVTVGILGLMSLGFAAYGLGVVRRQWIRVETDEDGLWFSPPRRRIAWNEVTRFRLAYFSTRRDGARGWMELKVGSRTAILRVDSRLERFNELAGRAWSAASRLGVEPDSNDSCEPRIPRNGGRRAEYRRSGMSADLLEVLTVRVKFRLRRPGVLGDAGRGSFRYLHWTSGARNPA